MLSGALYARTRPALPISGADSSSLPLLKTPTAQLAVNGGSQHPDKRKAGGHGPTLADEVEHLLPTPAARDWKGTGYKGQLPNAVALLPTPTVADSREAANFRPDGTPYGSGYGMTLTDASRRLLPTPRASDGDKGGPNQRGSKGDLALPAVAHRIGAPSRRPSRGGSRSSAAALPGQLMIGID